MRSTLVQAAITCIGLLPCAQANAQLTYQIGNTTLLIDEVVDSSRVNSPWEILWGPDDRLWMTDGPLITRWDPVTDAIDTLLDRGYGNGLGMALHPDFPSTPIIMAVYDTSAYYGGSLQCEVSRFTYDPVNDTITDEQVLLTYYHAVEHAGGRVLFDTTGHVLETTADYYLNGPDTLFSPVGKTLRLATLAGVMFNHAAGTDIIHVPYRGTGPALNDLLGGQLTMTFTDVLTALPHIQAGKLRALGVTTKERSQVLPEVPTIAEQGFPGFDVSVFFGLVVPAGTPKDVIARLHQGFADALKQREVRKTLQDQGLEFAADTSPEQLGAFIKAEVPKWRAVVKSSAALID